MPFASFRSSAFFTPLPSDTARVRNTSGRPSRLKSNSVIGRGSPPGAAAHECPGKNATLNAGGPANIGTGPMGCGGVTAGSRPITSAYFPITLYFVATSASHVASRSFVFSAANFSAAGTSVAKRICDRL